MNNFMKLFSIFVVFIQIQVALSLPFQSARGPQLIQQLCKINLYPSLCVSTLNNDPRSKNSDILGLALISMDATSKKFNESLQFLTTVSKTIKDPEELKRYKTCIGDYSVAASKFLLTALADLKAKKYAETIWNMKSVVEAPNNCEVQFAGKLTLTERNKAAHDIAHMTANIIQNL